MSLYLPTNLTNMPSVTVYKASAGSGKTFTLAIQYIRLLITIKPQEYLHTLAVTFTNKATTEMKDRILEQLYGISRGLKSSDDYMDALKKSLEEEHIHIDDDTIRKNCRRALEYILHDYSRFRIETIDSFFQSVLRNLAHELGLSARMQVDLNDKQILSQAVDNMIDGLGRNSESEQVINWIDNYVREQIENDNGWDIRRNIKDLAQIIFKEDYMSRDDDFRKKINSEEEIQRFRTALYAKRNVEEKALQQAINDLVTAIESFDGVIESAFSSGKWVTTYKEELVKGNYEVSITEKRMEALQNGPVNMVKAGDKNNTQLLCDITPICNALLIVENARIWHNRELNTINLALQHLNPLRLLNHIEQEVTNITNDSNSFILGKTPILLSRLIKDSDAPFVFEKMGTLFNNVMIDEFQDTSKLQWENFKVLLLESISSGGQNLLVGDIKQSIYRFRNGDYTILKNIKKEIRNTTPTVKSLDTNFRSDKNIIRFNNAFFPLATATLDGDDINQLDTVIADNTPSEKTDEAEKKISTIYSDVYQKWPDDKEDGGFVRVMLQTDKMEDWKERMLDDMCDQIKYLHDNGLPYNKMTVLMRTRTNVPEVIQYVQRKLGDVKMVSDEGFYLSNSTALTMIVSALRILVDAHGSDPVAERYLVQHYKADVLHQSIDPQIIYSKKMEEVLPRSFTQHFKELIQYPLYELCEKLYRILHLHRIKGEDAYLFSFYDELSAYLRNGTSDIHAFLEYWDTDMQNKAIPACKVDGIGIVTIHKSKGLQYHTVFMPFFNHEMAKVRDNEILWCDADEDELNMLGTLPINGSSKKFSESQYSEDYNHEKEEKRIEETNGLYVAFTRPVHNLFVWGCANPMPKKDNYTVATLLRKVLESESINKKIQKDGSSICITLQEEEAYKIWTYGTCVVKEPSKKKDSKKQDNEKEENRLSPKFTDLAVAFSSHNRHMDFMQSNEASKYLKEHGDPNDQEPVTVDGLSFIDQGKLLHEIFSNIHTSEEAEGVLKDYLERGILTNEKQVGRIRKLIVSALSNEKAKSWFNGHYEVVNECEIAHLDDDGKPVTNRPDRVMITDPEVVVVDFKFGRPNPEKYNWQVNLYMSLLQQMYPNHRVRGYLWHVYRDQIEEVPMSAPNQPE